MNDYINVTLVRIDKSKVLTIDGEDYLLVDSNFFNTLKSKRIPRPYTDTAEIQKYILDILKIHPGIRSGVLREFLSDGYGILPNENVMRGCMQRMRTLGLIYKEGEKSNAVWFPKDDG